MNPLSYRLAADLLLMLHVVIVLLIVGGLLLVLVGGKRGWHWVRRRRFRLLHLAAIAAVTLQAWLGRLCPLTTWEMQLRARAGDATYDGAFIAHWLGELLYWQAPAWVFALGYTLFAALVLWSWCKVKPR